MIVDVLQPYARDYAEDIELVEHVLQVDHPNLPTPALLFDHRLEGGSGGTMPPAGVEIDEINLCHYCFIPASRGCHACQGCKRISWRSRLSTCLRSVTTASCGV